MFDAYYATGKTGKVLDPYNARLSVDELAQLAKSERKAGGLLSACYIQFIDDVPKNKVGKIENSRVIKLYGHAGE